MTDLPDDPQSERIGRYGQILKDGKTVHDSLRGQRHYTTAITAIQGLTHEQLAHFALAVAAEAALTRSEDAGDGNVWIDWWSGVDDPDAIDTSPEMMRGTLRPDS
jgi:hypothetical protein